MTDKDDSKSQNLQGAQPLHSSPFIMNLVQLDNQKSLNRLKARSFKGNQLYELTPLKEDPEDPSQQIEGGPVRVQVRLWMTYCTNEFWILFTMQFAIYLNKSNFILTAHNNRGLL